VNNYNSIYWSDELYELFGLALQEGAASFDTWRGLLHTEDRQEAELRIEQAINDHLPLSSEYRIITPTGEVRWIRAVGDTDYNEQGVPLRMSGICLDVTKTKVAEIALHESEERLCLAQLVSNIGIWDWDLVHHQATFNTQYYQLLGLPEGISHGYEDFLAMVHPEDRQQLDSMVQQAMIEGKQDFNIEYRLIRKDDGATCWLASKGRFIVEDGRTVRSLGVIIDITERKQAETELERIQNMLAEGERIAHLGSWEFIVATHETIWSAEEKRIYGLDPAGSSPAYKEMLRRYIHPEDAAHLDRSFGEALENGAVFENQNRIMRPDGGVRWIYNRAQPYFDADGKLIKYIGATLDITDRKHDEHQLRIAATAFESHEGIMITDANAIILKVNQSFTRITGYTAEEVIGNNPRILSSDRHDKVFYEAMWDHLRKEGKWEGEIWSRRKDGVVYPERLSITAVRDENGCLTNYVGNLSDITISKAAEKEIELLAFYDPLTGLPNRRLLISRLNQAFITSTRSEKCIALLFLDLDNFKIINDTLGHRIGDLLLQEVAARILCQVREEDTVARLGGDEFVVMLEHLSEQALEAAEQSQFLANKILTAISQVYILDSHQYHCTSSIGINLFTGQQIEVDRFMQQADIAMYQAKNDGRNTLRFYDQKMQDTITFRASLERELRVAIDREQLQLYYQVQVDGFGHPYGAEVLIRWIHPERGLISPAQFIPLAEENNLILPIGKWVLEKACAQIKTWEQNALTSSLSLSVNVSAKQFRQVNFVEQVQTIVQGHGINTSKLKLELTESMLVDNVEDTITIMNKLNGMGVRFELDDFGTGYSSLQYLKNLPLYQLKIDQSFVHDIASNSNDHAIVCTIIAMAKSLELEVIAEGVETEDQRQHLFNKGCKYYQGYLFGKPMPIDEFEQLLMK